jgi:hypothetical protein
MKVSWPARLRSCLLTAVVLCGGGGMPLLDLALYHGFAPDRASAPHFESRAPHSHGDVCTLNSSLSHCPQVTALDLVLLTATTASPQPQAALSAPRRAPTGLALARAPPSLNPPSDLPLT